MPKLLRARSPRDDAEERQIRRLAQSRHAPGDWILRAQIIVHSWDGRRTTVIANDLSCHPQTVRERGPEGTPRFNAEGLAGLVLRSSKAVHKSATPVAMWAGWTAPAPGFRAMMELLGGKAGDL